MTSIAPHLTAFLREHLPKERRASPHTCEAYAYGFRILVGFAARRLGVRPYRLEVEQLDAPLILAFLEHIEADRGNSARTRNARLAAINAFFRFLEYRLPSCLDQASRIRAIPMKKTDEALVEYLSRNEIQALLDAPDSRIPIGHPRPGHASPGLRGRATSIRVGGPPIGPARPADAIQHPCAGKGTARARAAIVERDDDSVENLARPPATKRRPRVVPQRGWPCHDALRLRVHPGQARRRRLRARSHPSATSG